VSTAGNGSEPAEAALRQLVVVLGMHRSGTSALARALAVFGVSLGGRLMPAVAGDNDRGFWEDLEVSALNDEVLAKMGAAWDSPDLPPPANLQRAGIEALQRRALALLERKTAACDAFGVKDPRMSRLLPFWKPVFARLGRRVVYLVAVRNPMSVAQSLARRNGFGADKSYRLWMEHTSNAIEGTEGEPRLCVDFDELMLDPMRQLARIGRLLGREADEAAAREYTREFLDEGLRHTRFFIGDLESDPGAPPGLADLYWRMKRAAIDDRPQSWPDPHTH
jgi:hypothetical protein